MKINEVKFLKSASKASEFPGYGFPECAFFGRSNVGKSSLINMVTGRKSLVKVGAKPGMTRLVNFFIMNESIALADLPGFGYADVPKSVRDKFLPLINDYISKRKNLKLSFLLVDIRRKPEDQERDIVMKHTENNVPVAIIATKCDKLSKNQRAGNIRKIAEEFMIDTSSVFLASSKTGEGKKEIHKLIEEYCR